MSDRLKQLADAGVSIWLDDLSRERIETGNLADLVKEKSVVGVTTNPSIFAAALSDGERYDDEVRRLALIAEVLRRAAQYDSGADVVVRAECERTDEVRVRLDDGSRADRDRPLDHRERPDANALREPRLVRDDCGGVDERVVASRRASHGASFPSAYVLRKRQGNPA